MGSKHTQLQLILLLLAYYCPTHNAANGGNGTTVKCLPDQASSLLQLKQSFHNPNLLSWQHGTDCCHWDGVGCDRASGRVITLDLSYRNLLSTGGLSPALFNLTSLTYLSLAGNDFNCASLPNFGFEQLTNLLGLNLFMTRLSGQIPIGISHLKNLRTLDLSFNLDEPLYFNKPSFQMVVGNLTHLRELYLAGVDISRDGKTWSSSLANSVPQLQYLNLFYCGLSGHIHSSFSRLQSLESITLSYNGISGKVPQFLANFSSLSTLDLSENDFEGQFPTKIFQLNKLRSINLYWNTRLSGHLPNFPIENSLEELDLRGANFTVSIPTSSVNLRFLTFLGLSMTEVSEDTVSTISKLPSLYSLRLLGSGSENPNFSWITNLERLMGLELKDYNFSSSIPSWIGNLTSLRSLSLEDCGLYGRIPIWVSNLTKLSALHIGNNNLQGTVELSFFWRMKSLISLSLSNTMLSIVDEEGDDELSALSNMYNLDLASCNLTKLPGSLRYLDKVSYLDLSSNQISGVIPSWIWEKGQLEYLNLSYNMFTTLENSPSLVHLPKLIILDLSSNRLHGSIPIPLASSPGGSLDYSNNNFSSIVSNFGRYIKSSYLNLSKNKLNGHVPYSICSASELDTLDISYNNFSGLVPSCLIESGKLSVLKIRKNQFEGMLPENTREGCKFQTIDLNGNGFRGRLPRSLLNCRSLQLLDVGNNQISDSFPSWLGALQQLRVLVLGSNQLNGIIRDIKGDHQISSHFPSLQILDLSSNNFSGNLPKGWFNEMKTMMENVNGEGQVLGHKANTEDGFYQDTITVTFKGFELIFTKILTTFNVIDFSKNSFDGPIPESIGKLVSLHGLNMSYNNLTGEIPHQFSNLSRLESLDLSRNKLSGQIPQELTSLTALELLDFSYNNLSGKIPQGNQFSTFPNSSFDGNMGLCGLPLSKHCDTPASLAPNAVSRPESNSLWQDKLGVILLFAFVGLGFGVGFALSFLLRLFCPIEGCVFKH